MNQRVTPEQASIQRLLNSLEKNIPLVFFVQHSGAITTAKTASAVHDESRFRFWSQRLPQKNGVTGLRASEKLHWIDRIIKWRDDHMAAGSRGEVRLDTFEVLKT